MAIYLKKDMLNVAKSANLTVDLTKLGKVQLNRLYKFLMSGNISGDGVPAQIANALYKEHQQPNIHEHTWWVRWNNLPNEAIHEIQTVGCAIKMAMSGVEQSIYDSTQWLDDMVAGLPQGGVPKYALSRIVDYKPDADNAFLSCIRAITLPPSDTIKQLAEGIKARSINEVTIQIYTGE